MTKVLVTGATGALGKALIKELKSKDFETFATATKENQSIGSDIFFSACDLRNNEELEQLYNEIQPELIFHLAATFTSDLSEAYRVNVAASKQILELAQDKARVVLIGSAAEYGMVKPDESPVKEDHALAPFTAYGVSKAWQTQLLGFYEQKGADVVCARIFNLYGPNMSNRLFAGIVQAQIDLIKAGKQQFIEVGDLSATRDYLSTEEAVDQLLLIAKHGMAGNIYHVASGIPTTMREFLTMQLKANLLDESIIRISQNCQSPNGPRVPVIFADMTKTNRLKWQEA